MHVFELWEAASVPPKHPTQAEGEHANSIQCNDRCLTELQAV